MVNVSQYERISVLLYEDPCNPYESIYIRAKVEKGCLTVEDEEYEHGPDGGWSVRVIEFDEENTQKVLDFLAAGMADPFAYLKSMMNYPHRTRVFKEACKARNILFTEKLYL